MIALEIRCSIHLSYTPARVTTSTVAESVAGSRRFAPSGTCGAGPHVHGLELVYGPFQSLGVACTCRCETVTLESPITFLPICRLFVGITAASGSQVRRAWREPFSNRPDPTRTVQDAAASETELAPQNGEGQSSRHRLRDGETRSEDHSLTEVNKILREVVYRRHCAVLISN